MGVSLPLPPSFILIQVSKNQGYECPQTRPEKKTYTDAELAKLGDEGISGFHRLESRESVVRGGGEGAAKEGEVNGKSSVEGGGRQGQESSARDTGGPGGCGVGSIDDGDGGGGGDGGF